MRVFLTVEFYKIAKVKGKTSQNLIVFFTLTSPFSPTFVLKTPRTCLNITELSRDHSKVHWKQSIDTHGVRECYLVKKGLHQIALQGESGPLAGSRAQPGLHPQTDQWEALPCSSLLDTRNGAASDSSSHRANPESSSSSSNVWCLGSLQGLKWAIFGEKGAGKEENKPDLENPTNTRNIPP